VDHKNLSVFYADVDRSQESFRMFSDSYEPIDKLLCRLYHSETLASRVQGIEFRSLYPAYNSVKQRECRWWHSLCLELTPMLALGYSDGDRVENDRTVSLPVVYSLALLIHLLGLGGDR